MYISELVTGGRKKLELRGLLRYSCKLCVCIQVPQFGISAANLEAVVAK